ncbi:MAG: hypothetical protein EZS28_018064 [Streblomastix strix]|uniref:Uncharacterized protein n=1 Tax=Streblomastix strix TaxID=222440 RepID=A0A5J4VVE5_9EUKA|nr:MAG: hypothetical protein EZS28_018064 [Streblomastix strix]
MSPTPSSQSVHGRKNVTSSGIHITFTNNKRGGNNQTNVIVQLPPILNVGTEEGRQQMIQSVNEVQQAISGVQDNIKDGDIRKMQDKANEAEQRVASVKGPKSMLMTYALQLHIQQLQSTVFIPQKTRPGKLIQKYAWGKTSKPCLFRRKALIIEPITMYVMMTTPNMIIEIQPQLRIYL